MPFVYRRYASGRNCFRVKTWCSAKKDHGRRETGFGWVGGRHDRQQSWQTGMQKRIFAGWFPQNGDSSRKSKPHTACSRFWLHVMFWCLCSFSWMVCWRNEIPKLMLSLNLPLTIVFWLDELLVDSFIRLAVVHIMRNFIRQNWQWLMMYVRLCERSLPIKNLAKPYANIIPYWHENVILQVTGEPLIRRSDDNVDALKKRLNSYHTQTKPLVDYYALQGLHFKVDASKSAATVFGNIDGVFLKKRSARAWELCI